MRATVTPAGLAGLALLLATTAAAQTIVLPDIVVTADRAPTDPSRTGASVSVVTAEDLARQARPFVLDYLTQLPGVRVQQTGPPGSVSGFAVRGLPQQYVRVLVDGIEISDPTGPQVSASLSGLLTGDVARIEVLKGSQSALYGGQAVGGVIDLSSARPVRDGIEHRFAAEAGRYSTRRGAYTLAARSERADVAVSLLRFRTDGFSAAERRDGNPEPDGYATTRASFSGDVHATDTLRLFASGFIQQEDGDQDGSEFVPPAFFPPTDADETYDIRSWGLRGGAEFVTGPVTSTVSAAWFDIDREFLNPDGSLSFGGQGDRLRLDYAGRIAVSPQLALQVGTDYTRERATFLPSGTEADSWIAGAFAQVTWIPTDPLTLGLALRQDEHSDFGSHTTGRLTAAYALPTDTILRGSAGTGFRAPSLNELFGPFGPNPDLDPETSRSFDLGIEQRLMGGRARVSAIAFRIEIEDLIDFPVDRYVQIDGTSRSQGLELAAAWEATERLTLTGAYSYTDSRLPDGSRRSRVPRHDAVLGAEARVTDRVTLAATVQYVADVVEGTPVPGKRDIFGDYALVSARAAFALTETAELYVRAENLFDAQYQTARGYGSSDRAFHFGVTGRF